MHLLNFQIIFFIHFWIKKKIKKMQLDALLTACAIFLF